MNNFRKNFIHPQRLQKFEAEFSSIENQDCNIGFLLICGPSLDIIKSGMLNYSWKFNWKLGLEIIENQDSFMALSFTVRALSSFRQIGPENIHSMASKTNIFPSFANGMTNFIHPPFYGGKSTFWILITIKNVCIFSSNICNIASITEIG